MEKDRKAIFEEQLKKVKQQEQLRKRYINIDGRIISQLDLTLNDMAVLGTIFSGCQSTQAGTCELSYKFISELTHTSERTVMRVIAKLERLEYITKTQKTFEGEQTQRNTYKLTQKLFTIPQLEIPGLKESDKMSYTGGDNLTPLIKENKREIINILIREISDDDILFKELKKALKEEENWRTFKKVKNFNFYDE